MAANGKKYGVSMWLTFALVVIALSAPWWWPWREALKVVVAIVSLALATGYALWAGFGR